MGSPITTWDGVAAYFNGADGGAMVALWLLAAIVLTVLPIYSTSKHETAAYKKAAGG